MTGLTDDPKEARESGIDPNTGQQNKYVVLDADERSKGYVRPVRRSYIHLKCGVETTMGQVIAETYARNPTFYGGTFCVGCKDHFPVGVNGEFVWSHPRAETPLGEQDKVGT